MIPDKERKDEEPGDAVGPRGEEPRAREQSDQHPGSEVKAQSPGHMTPSPALPPPRAEHLF